MKRLFSTIVGILFILTGFSACSSPSSVPKPKQDGGELTGHIVTWTTSEPTLGAVAYRFSGDEVWRVAYPGAALREDKAFGTEHEVPLMNAAQGDTVTVRLLDRTADGRLGTSDDFEFVVGERPDIGRQLEWTMIDVGFGDSHLLVMPGTRKRILIDAGERRDFTNVDRFLEAKGITRLDAVAGTHIHADHIGGLVGDFSAPDDGILGVYEVGTFLDSEIKSHERSAYDEVLSLISARGIPRVVVRVGDTDDTNDGLDWDPDVTVSTLNAGNGAAIGGTSEGDQLNNDSIMFRLSFGEVDMILGGDSESPVETKLVADASLDLEGEVLKIHHHGLSDASSNGFFSRVNPRVGLIPITSYESNSGTLPSSSVLDRMRSQDVDIYASDRAEPLGILTTGGDGYNVTVLTDGESYEVLVEPSESVHFRGDFFRSPTHAGPEDETQ